MNRTNGSAALLISLLLLMTGALSAQEEHEHGKSHEDESKAGHSHAKAEIHGGEVTMTKAYHFEVVWMPRQVMVYLYDKNQKPLSAKGVTGEVTFAFRDGKTRKSELTLAEAGKAMPEPQGEGQMEMHEKSHIGMSSKEMDELHNRTANQDHLVATVDLGNVKAGDVKATSTLKSLAVKDESEVTFTSKYKEVKMQHHGEEHHHGEEQHH